MADLPATIDVRDAGDDGPERFTLSMTCPVCWRTWTVVWHGRLARERQAAFRPGTFPPPLPPHPCR